jgi:opacity protein-like surface antigen
MRKWIGSVLLLAAVAFIPAELAAQRRPAARPAPRATQRTSFGLQLDWGSDSDFGIGGRAVFGLQSLFPKTPLDGIVSFDYYFPSGAPAGVSVHFWEINGNVAYRFRVPARNSLRPYAGGGLNIAHTSASAGGVSGSNTDAGLNLLAGTTFKVKGNLTPFAEFRGVVGNANQVVLTGGVRF